MTDTLKEIRERVQGELDLIEEEWFDNDEMDKLIRFAVAKAHREIVTLYEDYFLALDSKAVSSTQNSIDYPSDIYANKIRTILFVDAPVGERGCVVDEIKSFKNLSKTASYNMLQSTSANCYYSKWIPYSGLGIRNIKLIPDNGVEGHVQIWYIRKPNQLINDDDVCDIPEFVDYVVQIAKTKYYMVDADPRFGIEKNEERALKKDMIDTLSNMKPDENTEIELDTSFYDDSN